MSVSISEGNKVDLDAIVAGGPAFLARIKEMKAAKADIDASFERLNLGRDAAAALKEAQQREQAALDLVENAKTEAAGITDQANVAAAEIVRQAHAEVEALTTAGNAKARALSDEVDSAHKMLTAWSEKTTTEANALMEKAVAVNVAANKRAAENDKASKDLEEARARLQAATEATNATQKELQAKLDAIKVAAS